MRKEPGKLKWILGVLVLWRVALLAIAAYAISSLPFKPSFPYWETLLEPNGHPLFWSWGNFDGVHYLTIAMHGYSAQFTQAFFPLYPLAIRYTQTFVGNYLSSSLPDRILFCFRLYRKPLPDDGLWLPLCRQEEKLVDCRDSGGSGIGDTNLWCLSLTSPSHRMVCSKRQEDRLHVFGVVSCRITHFPLYIGSCGIHVLPEQVLSGPASLSPRPTSLWCREERR